MADPYGQSLYDVMPSLADAPITRPPNALWSLATQSPTLTRPNELGQFAGPVFDQSTRQLTEHGRAIANMALGFVGGGMSVATAPSKLNPLLPLASRNAMIYDPPSITARPFAADYPGGAIADGTGRLLADIEGRPLSAPYVAGRTVVGEADQAVPFMGMDSIAEGATGQGIALLPARAFARGDVGQLVTSRNLETGNLERSVQVYNGLPSGQIQRVGAHEVGHAIDEVAGKISTTGLNEELGPLYNTLNNGNPNNAGVTHGPNVSPQSSGYSGAEVPREKMAEAIRGYMADPNYLKTVAPRTAAAIRAAVNAHPQLSKVIQFNAAGGLAYDAMGNLTGVEP